MLFQKYGLGTCSDEILRTYSKINVKYWEALERNELTKQEILVSRFREFFAMFGINPALAEPFNSEYQAALGDHLVFVDHAEEMLRAEKGNYTLIAVTSGTKAAQAKKLRRSGLDQILRCSSRRMWDMKSPTRPILNMCFAKLALRTKHKCC